MKFFKYICFLFMITFLVTFSSCDRGFDFGNELYFLNKPVFDKVYNLMYQKKKITGIRLYDITFLEKLFSLNFSGKVGISLENLNTDRMLYRKYFELSNDDFSQISTDSLKELSSDFTEGDVRELIDILHFMYQNKIKKIYVNPSFYSIDFIWGWDEGIQYRLKPDAPFLDVDETYIADSVYYVTYKP